MNKTEEEIMTVSRRDFLKVAGAGLATALGFDLKPLEAKADELPIQFAKETVTICPDCAVGCGMIVSTLGGRVINVEGDPDHPISEGALCPKGSSVFQLRDNAVRVTTPLYRAPGATKWQPVTWEWSIAEIAKRVKKSRDATFMPTSRIKVNRKDGNKEIEAVVNRTMGIASVGSAALDNEECYLYQKFLRGLGLVYIEHQARICHSSTVPALGKSFGRGAMTNHWIDLKNADVLLIMGANPADNHPISFRWMLRAHDRGAKIICVDPRFTRSAAKADLYAPLRSGTDIAFLGGMIRYIIAGNRYLEPYVREYTNAPYLVNPEFRMPGTMDGLFSGYDPAARSYDKGTWSFQTNPDGTVKSDPTLQDPCCIFQLLKQQYSRYTPEAVSSVTGTPQEQLLEVYKLFSSTGVADKAGTCLYAVGWTQHTVGVQNIRAMAIIQLLLGNIGIAGGGINALRGESNVQGSTDHGLLFDTLPGYLPTPRADQPDLAAYLATTRPKPWPDHRSVDGDRRLNDYLVSYLKAIYGAAATRENDFGYSWLPKPDPDMDCSWMMIFQKMLQGQFNGLFAWGQNPACSGPNSNETRAALKTLDWLVTVNLFDSETSSFWRAPGEDPARIKTEVFLLPTALSFEKEGSITNSGRWVQWRYAAVKPLGESRPDSDIMNELYFKLKELYAREGGALPEQLLNLTWNYGFKQADGAIRKVDTTLIAREINGYYLEEIPNRPSPASTTTAREKPLSWPRGKLVDNVAGLKADGSTSCGNWLYCRSYTDKGNMMARRGSNDPTGLGLFPEWSWSWPDNIRILYNRASVKPDGRPFNGPTAPIYWNPTALLPDGSVGAWEGDVPDGPWPPLAQKNGKLPFIMLQDGKGSIFAPGIMDGPFPEHYEPIECPVTKNQFSRQLHDPCARIYSIPGSKLFQLAASTEQFPIVGTTYRLTAHWQTGVMTRNTPWLLELQPSLVVEMSPELAREKGIRNGDTVVVSSIRGSVEGVAVVTRRLRPHLVAGRQIHEVGIPNCFGWTTKGAGDAANLLTPTVGDGAALIPEYKAFLVNVTRRGGTS